MLCHKSLRTFVYTLMLKLGAQLIRFLLVTFLIIGFGSAIQFSLICGPSESHDHSQDHHSTRTTEHEHAGENSNSDHHHDESKSCCDQIVRNFVSSLGLEQNFTDISKSSFQEIRYESMSLHYQIVLVQKQLRGTSTSPPKSLLAIHIPYTILLI